MKLTVNQIPDKKEEEVIINCSVINCRIQRLEEYVRQYSFLLKGLEKDKIYQIPAEEILFIDSVDGRTFLYSQEQYYESRESLASLQQMLMNTPFVRISKNCILNTIYLKSVRPLANHRMEANLKSGEKLIITRSYIQSLKEKIK